VSLYVLLLRIIRQARRWTVVRPIILTCMPDRAYIYSSTDLNSLYRPNHSLRYASTLEFLEKPEMEVTAAMWSSHFSASLMVTPSSLT